MLEQRVGRLEDDMREVKASLKGIEAAVAEIKHLPKASDYASLKADLAELKGRMAQAPTLLQLTVVMISTWSAGAAMVFTLLRFAKP